MYLSVERVESGVRSQESVHGLIVQRSLDIHSLSIPLVAGCAGLPCC